MKTLDASAHRRNWFDAEQDRLAFYLERPAVFSPAGAAQNAANQSRMLRRWGVMWQPWEYSGWLEEGRSFHDAAYIGDWTGIDKVRITGPDALSYLQYLSTNDLSNFAVGRMKHAVQVDENGQIAAQGVLYRLGEEEFVLTGVTSPRVYHLQDRARWNAEVSYVTPDIFLFSIQGPRSRDILEGAFGLDLKELKFNRYENFSFGGVELRVLRTGVSGALGFEVHGPSSHGDAVWAKIVETGRPMGIKELGLRAQLVSHVEAGIATNGLDFYTVPTKVDGMPQFVGMGPASEQLIGSHRIAGPSELYRSPAELGWFTQVSLDTHDFIGRDALVAQRDAGGPARRLVGLMWNQQDVIDIFASLFADDVLPPMELPRYVGIELNSVMQGGTLIGTTTSRTYSPFMRKMISLGHIDSGRIEPGSEVSVLWGNPRGPQREVRAEMVELPFKRDTRREA